MSSKECEEQLESLVEAWQLNEADLNQTDIEAIKHLLLENEMQNTEIQRLKNCLKQANEVKDEEKRRKELIQHKRNMYKSKYNKAQQRIDKADKDIQKLLDDINTKTIIGLNSFIPKLEVIQDELVGGNNE